jgi:hypothetical protein
MFEIIAKSKQESMIINYGFFLKLLSFTTLYKTQPSTKSVAIQTKVSEWYVRTENLIGP